MVCDDQLQSSLKRAASFMYLNSILMPFGSYHIFILFSSGVSHVCSSWFMSLPSITPTRGCEIVCRCLLGTMSEYVVAFQSFLRIFLGRIF